MAHCTHTALEWLGAIESGDPGILRAARSLYPHSSDHADLFVNRLRRLLALYVSRYGNGQVVIARAPGRINLMGRHIDHQGGRCNMMALDRDVLIAAGARGDEWFFAANTEAHRYPECSFHRRQLPGPSEACRWQEFLDAASRRTAKEGVRSGWSVYLEAPLARLSALGRLPDRAGMNLAVDGRIPSAAGLSSSSAIVVAVMEAVCALHGISLDAAEFVELCGEAEWYVGTRGGAGDHAAIKMAAPGHVSQLDFHPFRFSGTAPIPGEYGLLVCNTRIEARKTQGARDQFNHRVACYHLGRQWIYRMHPWLRERVQCLRDLLPDRSGLTQAEVLRIVGGLPNEATREEVRACLGSGAEAWLGTHADTCGVYPLRGVVLFGLAECARSLRAGDLLREGRMDQLGRLMNVSHDGDRVVRWNDGAAHPVRMDLSDEAMAKLIAAARDPASSFDLGSVPGYYGCSTPDLDAAVDIARSVQGVVGAQLSGAGLGGCIMVLAHREALDRVAQELAAQWFEPREKEPDVFPCNPSAGSGIITWDA